MAIAAVVLLAHAASATASTLGQTVHCNLTPPDAGWTCAWQNENYNRAGGDNTGMQTSNYGWFGFSGGVNCPSGNWDNCAESLWDNQTVSEYFYQNDNCANGGGQLQPLPFGAGGHLASLASTNEGNYNRQISSNNKGGNGGCNGQGV